MRNKEFKIAVLSALTGYPANEYAVHYAEKNWSLWFQIALGYFSAKEDGLKIAYRKFSEIDEMIVEDILDYINSGIM